MKLALISIFFLLASLYIHAKEYYLVYLKDKACNEYSVLEPEKFLSKRSLERRKRQNIPIRAFDLPVCSEYLKTLTKNKINVLYASKWLNAAYVKGNKKILDSLLNTVQFITKIQLIRPFGDTVGVVDENLRKNNKKEKVRIEETTYGTSFNQAHMICVDEMHNMGFRGENIHIAVFDGGFSNANKVKFFDSLYLQKRILGTYDIVSRDTNVYDDIQHGTQVLSCLAAYAEGLLIGTAYKASYYLFRTEDDFSEYPIEEANWLIAAEKADSLGVQIINSSLGYSTFDDVALNYKLSQMDGKTTIIAKAALFCARVGMIVVNSAGNESNKNWQIITSPADADSIIAVGAVDENMLPASFSLQGPTADGRIKPDLVARGKSAVIGFNSGAISTGNGTSFSSPILCGMVAGLWQALPYLTNIEIINLLKSTASQSANPNNKTGFGVPCFSKAYLASLGTSHISVTDKIVVPNPVSDGAIRLILTEKDTSKNIDVEIYDLSSKMIFKQFIPDALRVNVLNINSSTLENGLYFIKVSGDEVPARVLKLIKK